MKKTKTLCFIFLLILIALTLTGCSNNKDEKDKEKAVSEVKYLESKFTTLLNSMNNLKYENYKITTSKIDENSTSDSTKSEDKSDQSGSESSSSGGGQSQSQGQSKSQSGESESEDNQTQSSKNKYTLERTSTLTDSNTNIEWQKIKNLVEEMYSTIPTITLDLYNQNVNQDEILSFNNELDSLTVAVKEESKEKTLVHLSNLYGYLPKYLEVVSTDEIYTNLIKTKTNVINAYSIIDTGDWNKISEYINKAIDDYSELLNKIDNDSKMYSINKAYIILNELQNAVNLKDKEIFLIKYKNLLEEFNSI